MKKLEKFARDKSFGLYRGYFGERGWNERTISDILKEARPLMETAMQKAFKPQEGDWPTTTKESTTSGQH